MIITKIRRNERNQKHKHGNMDERVQWPGIRFQYGLTFRSSPYHRRNQFLGNSCACLEAKKRRGNCNEREKEKQN